MNKHYYSVPYTLAGEKVLYRIAQNTIEVLHQNQRVASHCRSEERDGKTNELEHMPRDVLFKKIILTNFPAISNSKFYLEMRQIQHSQFEILYVVDNTFHD